MNTGWQYTVDGADLGRTLRHRTHRVQVAKRDAKGNYVVENTFTVAGATRTEALERLARGMGLSRSQWNGKRPEYVLRVL